MNNVEPGFWRGILDLLLSPVAIAIILLFISIYVIATILNVIADSREEKDRRRREALRLKAEKGEEEKGKAEKY